MTIRRKDDGSSSILKWGAKESSYRIAVFFLVLSMHPLGRQVLGTFGFKFPDEQKLNVAAEVSTATQAQLIDISKDVNKLKDDVKGLTAKVDTVDHKVESTNLQFIGFQIDFEKYRKSQPTQIEK